MKLIFRLKTFFKDLLEMLRRKEMLILPGHLAYYFVLSIVPIITLIFFVATSFNLPVNTITNFIEANFSKDVLNLITPILQDTTFNFEVLVFLFIAFILATNGSDSIIVASNTIFNIPNSGFFKRRVKAIVITILLLVLFTFILVVPLFGESILKLLSVMGVENNLIKGVNILYPVLNIPLSLLVIFLFIKFLYTIAPDETIPSSYVNKGAIFTTISWILITRCYSLYINNFLGNYNIYYAGLSSIVILMLWFYLMAFVFVIGLAFNYRNVEEQIEKTNTLKLKELQVKVLETQNKKRKK